MSLEFQLLTARLEDRLPPAFPASDRARVVEDPCAYEDGVSVDKDVAGCVAFLFGRDRFGKSVAVRIAGVRPKLYFEIKEGEGLLGIKADLERELGTKLRASDGGILIQQRHLSHFYYYEPDASSPSARRVHSYAEASFPTLASFKEAINVRRRHETEELRAQLVRGAPSWPSARRCSSRTARRHSAAAAATRGTTSSWARGGETAVRPR